MNVEQAILPCAAALLLMGCDSRQQKEIAPSREAAPVPGGALAPPGSATETRDAFIAVMDKQLAAFDTKLTELRNKSETYKDDAKVAADQALVSLSEQRARLNVKMEELKLASGETWKDMKAGFTTAMAEFEKAYVNARMKIN